MVTGGGIVLRPGNVTRLKELGLVVNLSATEQVLLERISRRDTRPLRKTKDPRETLSELLPRPRATLPRGSRFYPGYLSLAAWRSRGGNPESDGFPAFVR